MQQVIELGGGSLIVKKHSLGQLLSVVYPEFKWNKDSFVQSNDIWNDEHLANYFVDYLKKQQENEVVYVNKVLKEMEYSANSILQQALKKEFPKYSWMTSLPARSKKTQYMLKECISKIFSDEDTILLEEYSHPEVTNLQLDFFYPQFNLAFEYQVFQCL